MKKDIIVGINPLLVTFRCNLRCKLCSTGTPYKKIQADFPLEQLQKVVHRQFEIIKFVRKFSLGGGEPTLHRQLPEFIEFLMGEYKDRFETLEILTNGVSMPSDTLLRTIQKYKDTVYLMIDDYGGLSKNAWRLSDVLTRDGIKHDVRCYYGESAYCGGWLDQGDFSHKFGHDGAIANINRCISASASKNNHGVDKNQWESESNEFFIRYICTVGGRLTRCARAISTYEAGVIPDTPGSFVNLLDESKSSEQLRSELVNLFSTDYYPACEYCNGYSADGERFSPAEQLTSVEFSAGGERL